jgi:hypothetical protein
MDLVNSPIESINYLLQSHPPDAVQQALQVCLSINMQLYYLDLTLDKLRYAVLARQYEDSLRLFNECHRYFTQYQSEIQRHHLQTLYQKYQQILDLLKTQLLDDFQPNDLVISSQLERAGEVLTLLTEHERIKFLQGLCDKICAFMPEGPFQQHYQDQLIWIYSFLHVDSKYRVLDRWEFNRFIIDAWANKIRDRVVEMNLDQINIKLFATVIKFERRMRKYHPNADGLLSIVFDPFCHQQIQTLIDGYIQFAQTNPVSLTKITANVYDMVNDRFQYLAQIEKQCQSNSLINSRNRSILLRFIRTSVLGIISTLDTSINEQYLKNRSHLIAIRSTFEYIKHNVTLMIEQLSFPITFQDEIVELINAFNTRIYRYYKSIVESNLEISTRPYRNGILSVIRETIIGMDEISDAPIDKIIRILQDIGGYDLNLRTYLLVDIRRYYESLIDISSLNNGEIKPSIFEPMLMDLCRIRDAIRDTTGIFNELENKIKFLNGSVLDKTTFIEQYKIFYPNNSPDMLKAIMKFKRIRGNGQ